MDEETYQRASSGFFEWDSASFKIMIGLCTVIAQNIGPVNAWPGICTYRSTCTSLNSRCVWGTRLMQGLYGMACMVLYPGSTEPMFGDKACLGPTLSCHVWPILFKLSQTMVLAEATVKFQSGLDLTYLQWYPCKSPPHITKFSDDSTSPFFKFWIYATERCSCCGYIIIE